MEREQMLNKVNTALNILDTIRADLINQGRDEKKKAKKSKSKDKQPKTTDEFIRSLEQEKNDRELETKELIESYRILLKKYDLPIDDDFINDLIVAVNRKGLDSDRFTALLRRVSYSNSLYPKRDIKIFIFKCINNEVI